jgi:hypothetical protein
LHKAVVIVPLLGWVGAAALVPYTRFWPDTKANQGTVVVVPPRPAEAPRSAPAPQPAHTIPAAGDRTALVRELQKELKRVGCYDGEISGAWTTSSRRAMRDFTDRVNAKLPIDQPDYILLRLVQGHGGKACGTACPAGQQDGPEGSCVPNAIAVQTAKKPTPPDARADSPDEKSMPLITGSAVTAAGVATAMPQPERSAALPAAKPPRTQPALTESERPQRSAVQNGLAPSVGVYERRHRHGARRARSRPPAVVRSLVRSVQRALGSLGIR